MGLLDRRSNSVDDGFFGTIKNGWTNMLKSIFGKGVDTGWSAAATGIGKGILLTLGAFAVGGLALGGMTGMAAANGGAPVLMPLLNVNVGSTLVDGMINGAYHGLRYALTSGIGYVAIGAAVGAVTDIRSFSHTQEASEAAARLAAHKASEEQAVAPKKQPAMDVHVDPFMPQTGWAERSQTTPKNEGMGR